MVTIKKLCMQLLMLVFIASLNLIAMHNHEEVNSLNTVLPEINEDGFEINNNGEEYDWETFKLFFSPVKKGTIRTLTELQENNTPVVNIPFNSGNKRLIQAVVEEPRVKAEKKRNVIRKLFDSRSFDPNVLDEDGRTPLLLASQTGQYPVVRELTRRRRTSLEIVDNEGRDVFDYAFLGNGTRLQKDKIMRRLIKRACNEGLDVWGHDLGNNSKTLLHICAENNLFKSVKLILNKKCISPNLEDSQGNSPLLCAMKASSWEVVELLTNINGFTIFADELDDYIVTCQNAYQYCMSINNTFYHMPTYNNINTALSVLKNTKKARQRRN